MSKYTHHHPTYRTCMRVRKSLYSFSKLDVNIVSSLYGIMLNNNNNKTESEQEIKDHIFIFIIIISWIKFFQNGRVQQTMEFWLTQHWLKFIIRVSSPRKKTTYYYQERRWSEKNSVVESRICCPNEEGEKIKPTIIRKSNASTSSVKVCIMYL